VQVVEIQGRFGAFRAGAVGHVREAGVPIELRRVRRVLDVRSSPLAAVGVPALLVVLFLPLVVVRELTDPSWLLPALAEAGWLVLGIAAWLLWRRSAAGESRRAATQQAAALTALAEAMAAGAGRFTWDELVLRVDPAHRLLTTHRANGTGEAIEDWPGDLVEAYLDLRAAFARSGAELRIVEVHALRSGAVTGRLSYVHKS